MSELLLNVSDEKLVKSYKSFVNEINQLMKNSKKSSNYIMLNGVAYSMLVHNDREGYFSTCLNVDILPKKKTLLKAGVDEGIKNMNGAFNGQELFTFYKNHKKIITEFNFYNDYFEILTSDDEIKFESSILTSKNFEFVTLKSYRTDFKKMTLVETKNLSEDEILAIKNAKHPFKLNCDTLNIRLNNKYSYMSSPTDVLVEIYETEFSFYHIRLIYKNELFTAENSFNVLKY